MSRRALAGWAPAILYAALIFAGSSLSRPQDVIPPELLSFDKLLHLAEYAVLGALAAYALRGAGRPPRRVFLWAVVLASLYGATDELHQLFVPGRCADVLDWAADTAGAALGAAVMVALRRRGHAD